MSLFVSPASALPSPEAPPPLSDAEKNIMNLIEDGVKKDKQFEAAQDRTNAAWARRDYDAVLELLDEQEDLGIKRQQLLDEALDRVAKNYGIEPQNGTIRGGGLLAGAKGSWRPKFYDDNAHFLRVKGPDGYHFLQIPQNAAVESPELAKTLDDGETAVRLKAFEIAIRDGNPRYLASTLYHESVHFQRLVSFGWGPGRWDEEWVAYEKELQNAKNIPLPQDEIDQVAALRDMFRQKVIYGRIDPLAAGPGPYTSREQERFNEMGFNRVNEWLDAIRKQKETARSLRGDNAAQIAASQRLERWAHFRLWSLYACQYIEGVHEGDPEWGNQQKIRDAENFYRHYLTNNLVVFGPGEIQTHGAQLKRR